MCKDSVRMAELFTCPVCLENYKDPRYLVCGHQFCRGCLARITHHTPREARGDGRDTSPRGRGHSRGHITIRCPTCRRCTRFRGQLHALPKPKLANRLMRELRYPEVIRRLRETLRLSPAGLSCRLCGGRYREPRQLYCGDQFCRDCLEGVTCYEAQGTVIAICCPICERTTKFKGTVDSLPRPILVNQLMEIQNASQQG